MTQPIEYLVIAPEAFHETLRPLIAYRSKGYETLVTAPETIYAASPDIPRELAIREYVRRLNKGTGGAIKFLLLVGDDETPDTGAEVPIGLHPSAPGLRPEIASDGSYGNMDDDPWPEVAVGRIPAKTPDELSAVVKKILAYETRRPLPSQSRLAFFAGRADFGALSDLLLESAVYYAAMDKLPAEYPISVHYDEPSSAFHSNDTFIGMLNRGAFILTYIGHGAPNGLLTKNGHMSDILKGLHIKGTQPILNLLACSAGCFANNDCLGEGMLLHPKGPIAVFGSNDIISPFLLNYFGSAMAGHLKEASTIGEVFLSSQREMEKKDDLFWRMVELFPSEAQAKMYLSPNVAEAAIRQGLQMTLLGDPALSWRPQSGSAAKEKSDPRNILPRPTLPMTDRIVLGETETAAAGRAGLDSRSASFKELATILTIVDYLSYRAAALLKKWKDVFPLPGDVTVRNGVFTIPLRKAVSIRSEDIHPAIRKALFTSGIEGEVLLGTNIQFGLTLSKERAAIYDIAGVSLKGSKKREKALASLDIDISGKQPIKADFISPPPTPDEIASANAELTRANIERNLQARLVTDNTTGEVFYSLLRRDAGRPDFRPLVKLSRFDPELSIVNTTKGLVIPLPFGTMPTEVRATGGGSDSGLELQVEKLPFGLKRQFYLFIPSNTHAEYTNRREIIELDFEGVGRLNGVEHNIMSIRSATTWGVPTYLAYPRDPELKLRMDAVLGGERSTGPLFKRAEKKDGAAGPSISDMDWSGYLGAEICFVLDTSGSMGEFAGKLWGFLEGEWEKVPSVAKYVADVCVVSARGRSGDVIIPPTSLSELGLAGFLKALDGMRFSTRYEPLDDAVSVGMRLVRPEESGTIYRRVVVLTDSEGAGDPALKDMTGVDVINVETLPAVEDAGTPLDIVRRIGEIRQVTATLTPPSPIKGEGDRSAETAYATIRQVIVSAFEGKTHEELGRVALTELYKLTNIDPAPLVPMLEKVVKGKADIPFKTEAVAALGVFSRRGTMQAYEALTRLQRDEDIDEAKVVTAIREELDRSVSKDAKAKFLYQQARNSPSLVDPGLFLDCGQSEPAVLGLVHIARYTNGRQRDIALQVLGRLLYGAGKDPKAATLLNPVRELFEELLEVGADKDLLRTIEWTSEAIGIKMEDDK